MTDKLDREIKSIFDNLRSVGSPQDYSLDEILIKAIGAERELLENGAKTAAGKTIFSVFREVGFQFQVATILLLAASWLCLSYVLPPRDQGVTKHFREIQSQVIK